MLDRVATNVRIYESLTESQMSKYLVKGSCPIIKDDLLYMTHQEKSVV